MKKTCGKIVQIVIFFFLIISACFVQAQESPFLPEKLSNILNNEISGERSYENIRWLSHYHRIMGFKDFLKAAQWIEAKARDIGLDNVHIVKQPFLNGISWDAVSGKLWLVEPEEIKIADFQDVAVSLAINSHSAHKTLELVDVGSGTEEEYNRVNVRGKVVLTTAFPGEAMETAVWQRGAEGVISSSSIWKHTNIDFPDRVAYMKIPVRNSKGVPSTWAFMISPRTYAMLKEQIHLEHKKNKPVIMRVDIESESKEPPEQAYVWAELRGSEIHNQDIVLTAHLDEERTSANDNGSGSGNVLEIGRALYRLIKDGKIPRPKRDIIFWWPNEQHSEYQYFMDHPEERKNMLVNINQDMVGAKQSLDSRYQQVIRTPYSIPSYLSDVIESITEYVILANTTFMTIERGNPSQQIARPIYSHLGTRERFSAMVIPYVNGSDHDVFCDGIIGIPEVSLINFPDAFMHSSEDDINTLDRTQLKRNAFITAAVALYLANAGDEDVSFLASEVYLRALRRIGKDIGTAVFHVKNNKGGSYYQSYKESKNLIRQAVIRESKAVESVLVFAEPGGRNEAFVKKYVKKLNDKEKEFIREFDDMYMIVTGEQKTPEIKLTAVEKKLDSKIPVNIESVKDYITRRRMFPYSPDMNSAMAYECYNFVNGKNSYLDIFNAVQAETFSVGEFYYGKVTLESVVDLLDNALKIGIIKLK